MGLALPGKQLFITMAETCSASLSFGGLFSVVKESGWVGSVKGFWFQGIFGVFLAQWCS